MFDYMDDDDLGLEPEIDVDEPYLPRGVRYDGIDGRKPSAVLAAIEGDVQHAAHLAAESGFDAFETETFILRHKALLALVKSSPHYDTVISSDQDQDWLEGVEWETVALKKMIEDTFEALANYVRHYQRYGWYTDDPFEADFAEVGVYIDWAEIEKHTLQGIVAEIDHPDDMDDLVDGVRYAILQRGDTVELWDVTHRRMEWST